MDEVDHLLIVGIVGVEKLHRVPMGVVTPVLPVLNQAVERNLQIPVSSHHTHHLVGTGVALLALIESEIPQRWQLAIAGKMAKAALNLMTIGSRQYVIVDALSR